MTDKVQKIKDWISREQDGLMDAQGNFEYPEHQGAYDVLCNLDAYIDSLQEEPVSKNFEMALAEMVAKAQKCVVEPWVVAAQWKDCLIELAKSEEPVSEELGDYVNELSKQFPEVSFAKLSRIAVRVAKWQKEKEYTCYEEAFEDRAKWKVENLWKPADGEDLPEIDREIIVLVDNFGKLIPKLAKRTYHLIENFVDEDTGEIISIENTNEVGEIINWTEPAIYWLDVDIPKLKED